MMLTQLLALHALCDYPLQSDFVARGKNHVAPLPGVPWWVVMAAHAAIHAGAVSLVAPAWCVGAEFFSHAVLDYAKNAGWFGSGKTAFCLDQAAHVLCKLAYWIVT